MTFTVGAERAFMESVLNGVGDPRTTLLRYGMLADDIAHLISLGLNASAMQLLSGLLRAKRVVGLSDSDIQCNPAGTLGNMDERYLRLGICCGSTFICDADVTNNDKQVFSGNNVALYDGSSVDFEKILFEKLNNVVQTWALTDGGSTSPVDVISPYFKRAARVVIYDRFFDRDAMAAVDDAFHAANGAALSDAEVLILIGRGDGGLTESQIKTKMDRLFVNPNKLAVSKCRKSPSSRHFLHDRYIQIDNAFTFVFPAGIGCFTCSSGKNRATAINLNDLYISHAVADIIRLDDNSNVQLRY